MSSVPKTTEKTSRNRERRAIDYVNVEYTFSQTGARNFLASIGATQRITPKSDTGRDGLSQSTDYIDGGRARQRKEKGVRNNKTKKQLQSTLWDTDSSSADALSVSSELLEARAREEEHYNKLKLNLNHLQNKRVRKGASVLYADKINGDMSFRQRTPSGSRMTRPHVIPGILMEQLQSRPSFLASKNEGHVNSVHSVSGKPMSRSSSILWKKTISRSFSTGDMYRIAREGIDGDDQNNQQSKAFAQRSYSFSEMTQTSLDMDAVTGRGKILRRRYENVGPINITPNITVEQADPVEQVDTVELRPRVGSAKSKDEHSKQRHSVIRHSPTQSTEMAHSNAETSDDGYPSSNITSPSPYLSPSRSPQRQAAADNKLSRLSPLARPADMKSSPLSPLLQPATLHNDTCPITCTCRGIHFIEDIVTIPCDSNGGEYVSEAHDFKIVIPKGAIKKRLTVELQIGVTLQGPFQTPQDTSVISPIVWIGLQPATKLRKQIEIKLPHFLDTANGLRKNEVFLRASNKMSTNSSKTRHSAKKYTFKEIMDGQGFLQDGHGVVLAKHCGFFCIAASKLSNQHAKCCLLPIIPRSIQSNTWKIHYCLTYLLKSCTQMVQRQFGADWEILPPRRFTFASEALQIDFERQLLEPGWILALESSNKIMANEVSLWSSEEGRGISTHPPRFTIRVHGGEARMSSMAQIKFTGGSEDINSEIVLPLRAAVSNGGTPLSTPTSSLFSPQHCGSQDSTIMTTPAPTQTRLGWPCHSPSCPCDDCSQDYDHLPSLEELGQTHVQLTYHNGHIDLPSDEYLHAIAAKVTHCLQGEWTKLQSTLDIPDFVMLDVLSQRSIELQVYRLLKEWRNHAPDCSKDKLAQCLTKADHRLEAISADLLRISSQ